MLLGAEVVGATLCFELELKAFAVDLRLEDVLDLCMRWSLSTL